MAPRVKVMVANLAQKADYGHLTLIFGVTKAELQL
jgi:hypothetical protein